MKGDFLGLIENKKVKSVYMLIRIKLKGDIVIERYNLDVEYGLIIDDVEKR